MNIRCPHCQNKIELLEEQSLEDLSCPSCGSHFSLVAEPTKTHHVTAKQLGHFTLVEQLGTGAHGVVWKAKDDELDRYVALKIPRADQLSEVDSEKFLREARSAAQLKHPNIVGVHEIGREDDTLFIVSDFVEGVTLADRLTVGQLGLDEAIDLLIKIADALDVAHEAGVVHRDLKPSNIMMGADGEPHIMDFGLAKRDGGEITMTVDGQILGTPAYMSPEQAGGDAHDCDARSDVYSLGVILFELLTGERPYRGNSRMLIQQVLHDEPPNPRQLDSKVPVDLDTICRKCLEKSPGRRYRTAKELADELRRYREGKPILARPIGNLERAFRFAKANPIVMRAYIATVLACVAIAVAIMAGVGFAIVSSKNDSLAEANESERVARQSAEQARDEANVARQEAIRVAGIVQQQNEQIEAQATKLQEQLIEAEMARDATEVQRQLAEAESRKADKFAAELKQANQDLARGQEVLERANARLEELARDTELSFDAFAPAIRESLREGSKLVVISASEDIQDYLASRKFQSVDEVKQAVLGEAEFPPGEFTIRIFSLDESGEPTSSLATLGKEVDGEQ